MKMNNIFQSLISVFTKKNLIFFILFASSFYLGGCWDRIELDDLAIVTATAIDQGDDGQVEVSLDIFIPKASGGGSQEGGGGDSGKTTVVVHDQGANLADALAKIQAGLPREIFWGSCKVFIFGEEAAKNGIQNHLDFLLRYSQPRESAYAFVSEGKAKKIIEPKAVLERYTVEGIRKIAAQEKIIKVTLKDLNEMLIDEAKSVALPYLKLKEVEQDGGKASKVPIFIGTAMFKKDRMVGILSESTTRGLLWLRDEFKDYTISIKPEHEKGEMSLFPVVTKVNLAPKISGDEWKMVIHVMTKGTIVQNDTTLDVSDPSSLKKAEKAYRESIEDRLRETIQQSQKLKVDAIHFGTAFHRKHPREWKKNKKQWEEIFPEVTVEFSIDATIHRRGYINKSIKLEER